jgi:cytochrome c-type biogenesis protein CcmE
MNEPRDQEAFAIESPAPAEGRPAPRGGLTPFVKVAGVFALLGGALALLMFGSEASDALVYSKLVHEVAGKPADFEGRELRVEGDLKQGSIKFREDPCEWRFTLSDTGKEMPVRFPQCIVPDTFKDGMGLKVTVQGKLTDDGYFLANQVIPRCPSKYEMQQRKERGEQMPHAMPGAPADRLPLDG